jgi:4-hydroxy-tetrahydrodipicolinate synthase
MKPQLQYEGVVVPMVTPLTTTGKVDDHAVDRLVEILVEGKVNGVFVLGTTGEGAGVSKASRRHLVERVVARVQSRALVYAGIGDLYPDDAVVANEYLASGADVVVARAPVSMGESEMEPWFRTLLDRLQGPVILYNIPMLTQVSIPLEVVGQLLGHPRLVGIKDSENNLERLTALICQYGSHVGFSVFVGVGRLMEQGLRLGAHGIVPSVGNLIPETCHQLWDCAQRGDWNGAKAHADRMNSVAAVYQADRDLGESLSALKAALSLKGICERCMFPPLRSLDEKELKEVADDLVRANLVDARGVMAALERGRTKVRTGMSKNL